MMSFKKIFILVCVFISGCSLAPLQNPSEVISTIKINEANDGFYAPLPHDGKVESLQEFWNRFHDANLSKIVILSQVENPTLNILESRYEIQKYTDSLNQSQYKPSISLASNPEYKKTWLDVNGVNSVENTRNWSNRLNFNWEMGLWGQTTAQHAHDLWGIDIAKSNWHVGRVKAAADSATWWVEYRGCENATRILNDTKNSMDVLKDITAEKISAGILPVSQGYLLNAQYDNVSHQIAENEKICHDMLFNLANITNKSPSILSKMAESDSNSWIFKGFVVESVPLAVMEHRLDVITAKQKLYQSYYKYESIRSERLPKLSLSGNLLSILSNTAGVGTNILSLAISPVLSLILFDGNRVELQGKVQHQEYEIAKNEYLQTIKTAISEVQSLLSTRQSVSKKYTLETSILRDLEKYFLTQEEKYKLGLIGLYELENVRQDVLKARLNLNSTITQNNINWIMIYKAVGGDFDVQK